MPLAVLVATPCTAPFMGTAAAWAATQAPAVTLATFAAIGAGMVARARDSAWIAARMAAAVMVGVAVVDRGGHNRHGMMRTASATVLPRRQWTDVDVGNATRNHQTPGCRKAYTPASQASLARKRSR